MSSTIVEIHAALEALWQILLAPGITIVDVEVVVESSQPVDHLVAVVQCSVLGNHALEHDIAFVEELISPITIGFCSLRLEVFTLQVGSHCYVRNQQMLDVLGNKNVGVAFACLAQWSGAI